VPIATENPYLHVPLPGQAPIPTCGSATQQPVQVDGASAGVAGRHDIIVGIAAILRPDGRRRGRVHPAMRRTGYSRD
jgi:hypothetical protein